MIRSAQGTTDRGQSEVLGVVLLLGIVGIAAISLLLVGGQAISETEREAEHESVEQSFVELSQTMATSADNGDVSQSVEIDAGEHGAITKVDNGWMNVTYEDDKVSYSIGTIEYQGEEGTKVAYEAGGVFRETGQETRLVSTPNIHYDRETETLTMPIINISSSTTLDSGSVHVTNEGTEPFNDAVVVEEENITIRVESEYYMGWKQFFERQAGDTVIEDWGQLDDEKGYVVAKLGYNDIDNAFSSGVSIYEDEIEGKDKQIPFDDVDDGAEFKPINDTIDAIVEEFDDNDSIKDVTGSNGDGKYYTDELSGNPTFDLSSGDAMVAVGGDIAVNSDLELHVTDCGPDGDNTLRVYSKGDMELHGDSISSDCDAIESVQVYGQSDMGVNMHASGNTEFRGLLYAASYEDSWEVGGDQQSQQIEFGGGGQLSFEGSIVANSVSVGSNMNNADDVVPENGDIDVIPEGYEPAPKLTFLNVVEHDILVDNG